MPQSLLPSCRNPWMELHLHLSHQNTFMSESIKVETGWPATCSQREDRDGSPCNGTGLQNPARPSQTQGRPTNVPRARIPNKHILEQTCLLKGRSGWPGTFSKRKQGRDGTPTDEEFLKNSQTQPDPGRTADVLVGSRACTQNEHILEQTCLLKGRSGWSGTFSKEEIQEEMELQTETNSPKTARPARPARPGRNVGVVSRHPCRDGITFGGNSLSRKVFRPARPSQTQGGPPISLLCSRARIPNEHILEQTCLLGGRQP
jgi:hypothetical protein